MPTVLDQLGIAAPDGVEGGSFGPLLAGEPFRARDEAFSEATRSRAQLADTGTGWVNRNKARAIRVDDRKLIVHPTTGQRWLFDPTTDPLEQIDLLERDDDEQTRRSGTSRPRKTRPPDPAARTAPPRISTVVAATGTRSATAGR